MEFVDIQFVLFLLISILKILISLLDYIVCYSSLFIPLFHVPICNKTTKTKIKEIFISFFQNFYGFLQTKILHFFWVCILFVFDSHIHIFYLHIYFRKKYIITSIQKKIAFFDCVDNKKELFSVVVLFCVQFFRVCDVGEN